MLCGFSLPLGEFHVLRILQCACVVFQIASAKHAKWQHTYGGNLIRIVKW